MQNQLARVRLGLLSSWERLSRIDPLLLALSCALLGIGLAIIYSSSGTGSLFYRHAGNAALMLSIIIGLALVPFDLIIRYAPVAYGLSLLALLMVLAFGINVKGGQRWLNLGLVNLQPSEIAKVATVLMMVWVVHGRPLGLSLMRCLGLCAIVVVPCALIVQQPDLGTALVVAALGLTVLFLAGIEKRLILLGLVLAGIATPIVWNNLHDYQKDRILSFSGIEQDLTGSGYHAYQSKISVGSGGLYGKGWQDGTQGRLDFLPERSTDFAFSVFAEEFGFFGATLLLVLFLWVCLRIFTLASQLLDNTARILLGAAAVSLFLHLFINIGMVVGLLPVVGVPLPFISYGGSAAIGLGILIGLVNSACVSCPRSSQQ